MKLTTRITAVFERVLDVLSVAAGVLLAFLMIEVSVDVFMRYFLNRPIAWTIESTQYAMVFILYLGAAWLLRDEGHVVMDIVVSRLGQRRQDLTNAVTSVMAAIVCFIITWYGMKVNIDYFRTDYVYSATLDIPAFLLQGVVPLGAFLLFIQFLRRAYGYLRKLRAR
jgi:C4-dicarboxylate transporter DctQ subunit